MMLLHALRNVVGDRHVLTDPEVRAPYERDWTGRFGAPARAVVRPASTSEIAAVLRVCTDHEVPVIPQGGNTGLVGGGVPRGGEVVLSASRLVGVGDVHRSLGHVEVAAGTPLSTLQHHAALHGLDAGIDFAARESATIGGIVACDAGGARALRHGTARAFVRGLEAVLPDGSRVQRMAGLTKDNAGLDLPALLVGSEGTLGVITRVVWKLAPRLPARVAALVPLADAEHAADLLAALHAEAPSLECCELMTNEGVELVLSHQRRRRPVPTAPFYVLVELASRFNPIDELAAAFARAGVDDAAVAEDTTSRGRLWALREGHADAVAAAGVPHKVDVGVPLASLPRFFALLPEAVGSDARAIVWAHLGDGNLHVNVLGPAADDQRIGDSVLRLALACGGTISAEHGVGTAKAHWLQEARGADEVRAMRAIKMALDPDGLMNPGVILPPQRRG